MVSGRHALLEQEKGSYLKKWTGRSPVALVYPNTYEVGMSSLGFQLVYSLLNTNDTIVCERFFLPEKGEQLLSIESGRTLNQYPLVFFSVSFEHDYVHLVELLQVAGIVPLAEKRSKIIGAPDPLVICGGVSTFMNPEPLAPFIDLFLVGEAEPLLPGVLSRLLAAVATVDRKAFLLDLVQEFDGLYAPIFYSAIFDSDGKYRGNNVTTGVPARVKKTVLKGCDRAAHSQITTPVAEFAKLYLTELGRGCSRGCRFCAAGFIYRPPRLWDGDAVVKGLEERFAGIKRVGLLGMEMADKEGLEIISRYLTQSGCSLSFSSLRADRVSGPLLELLSKSDLKSVAIAPDGASERLRKVINKGLREKDLVNAAVKLVEAGIYKLKIYVMIGLPTETLEDLSELLELLAAIKEKTAEIGRKRGRLSEIYLSVNCFTPKPWTPFQYHAFGTAEQLAGGERGNPKEAVSNLKEKVQFLRKGLAGEANVHLQVDKPEKVLFQAVLARGDRRLAKVLLKMVQGRLSWKQAMKSEGLKPEQFAVCGYDENSHLPWYVIDHGIDPTYLWAEYKKSFSEKTTIACDTEICCRCGVCRG